MHLTAVLAPPTKPDQGSEAAVHSPDGSGTAGCKREREEGSVEGQAAPRVKVGPARGEPSPPPPQAAGAVRWRQDFIEKCVKTHYDQIAFVGKVCRKSCTTGNQLMMIGRSWL